MCWVCLVWVLDTISSCSYSLSVVLRVEEEDLDRILEVLSFLNLFMVNGDSCVFILIGDVLRESGDEGRIVSGSSFLRLTWGSY